mgnify:CR=1 FL=1
MRIPVPWPAPEVGEAFPERAQYLPINRELEPELAGNEQVLLLDLFTEEGLFVADWEARLWDIQQRYPGLNVILQVTALPPALIFPDTWGIKAYLVHGPTWQHLHGIPLPLPPSSPPYTPRGGWSLISPAYEPPHSALQTFNTFLRDLQTWRRTLSSYQPEKSSLFYTVADRVYTHFSLSELNSYVASIRR